MRPLPLAIAAMTLLAGLKLVALMQGPIGPTVLASAGRAMVPAAQASSGEGGAEAAKPAPAVPEAAKPTGPASSEQPATTMPAAASAAPPVPPASAAEMTMLQDLRARREALDKRAQALEAREALLAAAERRVGERVDQLAGMQTRLEALRPDPPERDEANWRG